MAATGGADASTPNLPSCSVCLRTIAITAGGLIRQHGPVSSRCPGSRRPPVSPFPAVPQPLQRPSTALRDQEPEEAEDPSSSPSFPLPHCSVGKILKRLPKASRGEAGKKFATILDAVVSKNDHASWVRLLYFSTRCLGRPDRGGRRRSLATAVNRQLREEADPPPGLGLALSSIWQHACLQSLKRVISKELLDWPALTTHWPHE